jgi:hypothetical protein
VPHGWRAAFSTIMNEKAERDARGSGQKVHAELDAKVIDLMLAHVHKRVDDVHRPRDRDIAKDLVLGDVPVVGLVAILGFVDPNRMTLRMRQFFFHSWFAHAVASANSPISNCFTRSSSPCWTEGRWSTSERTAAILARDPALGKP